MKLKVVGTSHSMSIPHPLCYCRVCDQARLYGGRDVRTRTSVHIHLNPAEDIQTVKYKVDLGPDTAWQMVKYGCDLRHLQHLLITHTHGDHLSVSDLAWRGKRNDHNLTDLHIYGPPAVGIALEKRLAEDFSEHGIIFHSIKPYSRYQVGEMEVYPIVANHIKNQLCFNYVILSGGRTVFLAWDTGLWSCKAWEHLKQFRFDAVLLECTYLADITGEVDDKSSHMTTDSFIAAREKMISFGLIRENTPFLATHICDGGFTHAEGQNVLSKHNCKVAYDGMELSFPAGA